MDQDLAHDVRTINDALIALSGHLPLFSGDRSKVARASKHLAMREDAWEALDRLADALHTERPTRRFDG